MRVHATTDTVAIRFGKRFGTEDATRLSATLEALGRLSEITLDFSEVKEFDQAGIAPLAAILDGLGDTPVCLRGLTRHQARVLAYFGVKQHHEAERRREAANRATN